MTEIHTVTTEDGIELRLTRRNGGAKGPVLVVHGAGVHSGMFTLPTVEESFAPYLADHGYDTWLLDWRASTLLPLRQFTLDDSARYDFPAAVDAIRGVTKAKTVQAVVHCAGAI
jgi:poly(3-hydroxyalkanoate) synthetase